MVEIKVGTGVREMVGETICGVGVSIGVEETIKLGVAEGTILLLTVGLQVIKRKPKLNRKKILTNINFHTKTSDN